jgi:hypothetical protein
MKIMKCFSLLRLYNLIYSQILFKLWLFILGGQPVLDLISFSVDLLRTSELWSIISNFQKHLTWFFSLKSGPLPQCFLDIVHFQINFKVYIEIWIKAGWIMQTMVCLILCQSGNFFFPSHHMVGLHSHSCIPLLTHSLT